MAASVGREPAPVILDGEILHGAKLAWVLERRVKRTPTFWGSTPLPALQGYTVLSRQVRAALLPSQRRGSNATGLVWRCVGTDTPSLTHPDSHHGSQLLYARTSVRSPWKLDHCLTL